MKRAILLNLSTMVRMTMFPLEQGNPVTKSKCVGNVGPRTAGEQAEVDEAPPRPGGALCWLQTARAMTYS